MRFSIAAVAVAGSLVMALDGFAPAGEPPRRPAPAPLGPGPASARPPAAPGYAVLSLRWRRGRLTVESVERGRYATPTTVKRYVGRFEARVLVGGRIVDSLRFDFPLLGEADPGNQGALDEAMRKNLSTEVRITVPITDPADAIAIVDTHGGAQVPVKLPPPPPPPRDGGAP